MNSLNSISDFNASIHQNRVHPQKNLSFIPRLYHFSYILSFYGLEFSCSNQENSTNRKYKTISLFVMRFVTICVMLVFIGITAYLVFLSDKNFVLFNISHMIKSCIIPIIYLTMYKRTSEIKELLSKIQVLLDENEFIKLKR